MHTADAHHCHVHACRLNPSHHTCSPGRSAGLAPQYLLDPKIASMVSSEIERDSIVVFDEAHNIDNVCTAPPQPHCPPCTMLTPHVMVHRQVCIEALSINLDKRQLDLSSRNVGTLITKVNECVVAAWPTWQSSHPALLTRTPCPACVHRVRMQAADQERLTEEYRRLVAVSAPPLLGTRVRCPWLTLRRRAMQGLSESRNLPAGGEELMAAPVLPADVLEEAIPGNIRNAKLFLRLLRTVVTYLKV